MGEIHTDSRDQLQRALTAATMTHPDKLADLLALLYDAIFVQHQNVAKAEDFTSFFAQVLGEEAAKEVVEKVDRQKTSPWQIFNGCVIQR